MHKFALAAAAAALALTGTAATAQMDAARTTTTTTQTMQHPMGTMERTTVKTHTMNGTMPGHKAMKSKRHCKTWWKNGKKMRSCKMTKRHRM